MFSSDAVLLQHIKALIKSTSTLFEPKTNRCTSLEYLLSKSLNAEFSLWGTKLGSQIGANLFASNYIDYFFVIPVIKDRLIELN